MPVQINFYHLTSSPLGKALPKLLEKALAAGMRCVVNASDEQAVEKLNSELWTYTTKTFLPHGSSKDGYKEKQPIYLTASNENPNQADLYVFVGTAEPEADLSRYKKCLYMFDGNNEQELNAARNRWRQFKKNESGQEDFELKYWQQNDKGGWEEKVA